MIRTGYRAFSPALAVGQGHAAVRASIKKCVRPSVTSDENEFLAKQHYRFGFCAKLPGKESGVPVVTKPQFCGAIASSSFCFYVFIGICHILQLPGGSIVYLPECVSHVTIPP